MKNIGKILKRAAVAALCAVGLLSLTGCDKDYGKMMNEAPAEYIAMAAGNAFRAMSPVGDSSELLKKAAENGSLIAEFEADGIAFRSETAVSSKDNAASTLFTMTGSSGASAQLYAYAGKNGAKIGTMGQSGSHIYDITYEGMAEKLAASIFAPQSGSMYAMSQSDYDEIMAYIDQMAKAVSGGTADDEYSKIFTDYFDTHKPQIVEKAEADIDGETVSSNVITYNIPTADVKALANSVFELIMADGALKEQLPEYYDEETMRSDFDEFMDMLEECSITAEYCINAKTNVLMKSDLSVNIKVYGQTVKVYVKSLLGADPANTSCQTFDAGADIGGETVSFNMVKQRDDNGWTLYAYTDFMGEKTNLFAMTFKQEDKNYTLDFKSHGDVVVGDSLVFRIEGTVDTGKTSIDMTVDKVTFAGNGETVTIEPKASVTVKTGGEIYVPDAEKELFDLTEEELDALSESIDSDFGAVIDEADGSGAMGGYVRKSMIAQANANAKTVHTSCMVMIVQELVSNDKKLSGVIEGNGTDFTIGGERYDFSDLLGEDFTGYSYGYANKSDTVEWTLWSKNPIPEAYKKPLTREEQDKLAGEKIFIGCYPVSSILQ